MCVYVHVYVYVCIYVCTRSYKCVCAPATHVCEHLSETKVAMDEGLCHGALTPPSAMTSSGSEVAKRNAAPLNPPEDRGNAYLNKSSNSCLFYMRMIVCTLMRSK